jgi:hypothetical protein
LHHLLLLLLLLLIGRGRIPALGKDDNVAFV